MKRTSKGKCRQAAWWRLSLLQPLSLHCRSYYGIVSIGKKWWRILREWGNERGEWSPGLSWPTRLGKCNILWQDPSLRYRESRSTNKNCPGYFCPPRRGLCHINMVQDVDSPEHLFPHWHWWENKCMRRSAASHKCRCADLAVPSACPGVPCTPCLWLPPPSLAVLWRCDSQAWGVASDSVLDPSLPTATQHCCNPSLGHVEAKTRADPSGREGKGYLAAKNMRHLHLRKISNCFEVRQASQKHKKPSTRRVYPWSMDRVYLLCSWGAQPKWNPNHGAGS